MLQDLLNFKPALSAGKHPETTNQQVDYLRNKPIKLLLTLVSFLFPLQFVAAQSTTISTETGTNFTGNNGGGAIGVTGAVTFVVENNNAYPIILNGVDAYWKTPDNGGIPTLWYSNSSLAGTPTIAAPVWTSLISAPALSITANGYHPTFTNLSFFIPAGGVYRFALSSTNGVRYSGTGNSPIPSPSILSGGGVNLKVYNATVAGNSGDVGYGGNFPNLVNSPRAFTGRIHFQQALPCTAPPTAGQAVSSINTVCPKANFVLSLTGASIGTGLSYQWQSSTNGTIYTDIAGATNSSYTATQNTTTHYRAQVTCGGQTASSGSVQVNTNPTPAIITIDKNAPASATSFTSITSALQSLSSCGVSGGPILLNVAPNSGPYNEQVVITPIQGASANSMVTIKGNGNTITATPGTTHLGVFTLDGADFIRIDSFTIALNAAATTGWGVQLKNAADNNIISNNTINLPLSSNSEDINGIIAGHDLSGAPSVQQGNFTNNTVLKNNIIKGGYYGIRIKGSQGAINAVGNQIIGNSIRDFYTIGIYLSDTDQTLIERNDISRPTRTVIGQFYGIYFDLAAKKPLLAETESITPMERYRLQDLEPLAFIRMIATILQLMPIFSKIT